MRVTKLAGFALVTGLVLSPKIVFSVAAAMPFAATPQTATTRVPLTFSGGHETDPRDRGRPVVLIASALGVPPDVFREAFSHVHPAPAGEQPNREDARRNKDALLQALSRYGVTNERLDEVSNYYRYDARRGELWPIETATGFALFKGGKITGFEITSGGSGYSSAPSVSVSGIKGIPLRVQLAFSQELEENGAVTSVGIVVPISR